MSELLAIVLAAAIVNNVVLTRFLGVCPFVGASDRPEAAVALGLSTAFVLTLATALAWIFERAVLEPLGVPYLRLVSFVLLIAATVQLTEILVRWTSPLLYQVLGLHLPLIASNCAVLGIVLLNLEEERSFIAALAQGLGTALGFALVLVLMSGLRERIDVADVPAPFRGPAIALVTAGLMALALLGLAGMVAR